MSDPYGRVKGGRLAFKGGDLATRSKSIDKKNKKKKKKHHKSPEVAAVAGEEVFPGDAVDIVAEEEGSSAAAVAAAGGEGGDIYTIDAAKRRKYDELFPVEAKKFGYDPKSMVKSVEEALDDRVKKKADRYCK